VRAWWNDLPVCDLCHATAGLEMHHKVYRSRGGSDRPENLVRLCRVCHAAAHGLAVTFNGHNCRSCRVLKQHGCHFGEVVTGKPGPDGSFTTPPWDNRKEST
jgi:hypothetical protein